MASLGDERGFVREPKRCRLEMAFRSLRLVAVMFSKASWVVVNFVRLSRVFEGVVWMK